MRVAEHTHRELVAARAAVKRAVARLSLIGSQPIRTLSQRRRARAAVCAVREAAEVAARATVRDERWHRAQRRASLCNLLPPATHALVVN